MYNDHNTFPISINILQKYKVLDSPGGIPTSLMNSGQQWDYPNAWSPLVHFTLESLSNLPLLEAQELTQTAARNWVMSNMAAWQKQGDMYEKVSILKNIFLPESSICAMLSFYLKTSMQHSQNDLFDACNCEICIEFIK
jgi:neutral trehalase